MFKAAARRSRFREHRAAPSRPPITPSPRPPPRSNNGRHRPSAAHCPDARPTSAARSVGFSRLPFCHQFQLVGRLPTASQRSRPSAGFAKRRLQPLKAGQGSDGEESSPRWMAPQLPRVRASCHSRRWNALAGRHGDRAVCSGSCANPPFTQKKFFASGEAPPWSAAPLVAGKDTAPGGPPSTAAPTMTDWLDHYLTELRARRKPR